MKMRYQARDVNGNALTLSSVSDANKSGLTVSVKESDDFYRITGFNSVFFFFFV